MDGDDRSSGSSGGFDDWLEEEPGPDSDPYAALSDDDAEAEIADWMAFTQGESDEPEPAADRASTIDEAAEAAEPVEAPNTDSEESDDFTDEMKDETTDDSEQDEAAVVVDLTDESSSDYADFDDGDETGELQIVEPDESVVDLTPSTSVDQFEFDGGGRPDTEELPILSGADVVSASVTNDSTQDDAAPGAIGTSGELDDPDAIVEMQAIVIPEDDAPADDPDGYSADTDELIIAGAGSDDAHGDDAPDDTGELDLIGADSDADEEIGAVSEAPKDPDDTGELDLGDIAAAATVAAAVTDDGPDLSDEPDTALPFDISREDYLQTATREHEGLAAAIAEAEGVGTERVALSAPIPGIEDTVIGFEDVVEAEGHGRVRARGASDLLARVITAIVLIIALAASLLWQPALLALATVVFVIAAGEFYTALAKAGRHPIGLFGFIGIIGASVGAFVWGAIAIPVSFGLVVAALLLYYAVVPGRRDPVGNLALTTTVMVWVGLGTYAMLIAVSDDYRRLVVGVVVLVAAMDIAQYFVGRALGRHQLSPWVSPKKTIEGLVGGVVVAFALGALLHFIPPFELTSGLVLGAAVAVLTPLGDLAVSAAKRSLDIKDMGSILPGHGGFLDRIDGLLFVIPAAWVIFLWAGIL